jgi:gas vesicle protein/predicted Zn-ribbon and HTH transcriptional regulator
MFFLLPLIGAAVGAVAGACITHANGEKDRRSSKHHRQVANELRIKYSDSQARYNELNNNSQKKFNDINQKKALDETEKDLLRLTIRLQQSLYILMWDIDKNPTRESLVIFEQAVIETNKVLRELREEIIQVPAEYFSHNLERVRKIEEKHSAQLIKGSTYPTKCRKCGKKNRIRPHSNNHNLICNYCKCRLVEEIIKTECTGINIEPDMVQQDRESMQARDINYLGTFSTYESYINWFQVYRPSLKPLSEIDFYYSWRYSDTLSQTNEKTKSRNNRKSSADLSYLD